MYAYTYTYTYNRTRPSGVRRSSSRSSRAMASSTIALHTCQSILYVPYRFLYDSLTYVSVEIILSTIALPFPCPIPKYIWLVEESRC